MFSRERGVQTAHGFHAAAFLVLLPALLAAAPDPAEIMRRSLQAELDKEKQSAAYAFIERVEMKQLDGDGRPRKVERKTWHVVPVEGTPHRRLLRQDDKPLPADQEKFEADKLKAIITERPNETREQREQRLADEEKRRARTRSAMREIPEAFLFRIAGETTLESRPVWIIDATPRPGYQPRDRRAKLFTGLKGRLWIDKADSQWARAEGELVDDVTFGWIIARIYKGGKAVVEQRRVGDLWMPSRLWYTVKVRLGLIRVTNMEQEATYRDYRPFRPEEFLSASR